MPVDPPQDKPDVFGPGGGLSTILPAYEFRPQQQDLAEAFTETINQGGVILAEAGTGSGKTFAYLAPAIQSGMPTIISTGTRNLQDQVYHKDIPLLAGLWPGLKTACLKGRANYLCRQRLYEALRQPHLPGSPEVDFLGRVSGWSAETGTGDRSELPWLADEEPLWSMVSTDHEACLGSSCPNLRPCFVGRARRRAAASDLVVVNHHLLMVEAARGEHGLDFLPGSGLLIVDEAHLLEEVATRYLGLEVTTGLLARLFGEISPFLVGGRREKGPSPVRSGFELLDRLLASLPDEGGAFRFRPETGGVILGYLDEAASFLESLKGLLEKTGTDSPEVESLVRRAGKLSEEISFISRLADPGYIYWYEKREGSAAFNVSPVDVSSSLPGILFDRFHTVLLTSATLAVGGDFTYIRQRLGLPDADEFLADSPFDYRRQAILYIPGNMPPPNSPEFPREAARKMGPLLHVTEGRAFVLCTSRRNMESIHSQLKKETSFRLLIQGEAPRSVLLEDFRKNPRAVLVATISFWQGVDVPGAELSGVIIDRLPFASPDDPITEGRINFIRDQGGNPFLEYQLPSAVIMFRQGLGRLIRLRTDLGIMAVMDPRILQRSYGKIFLDSLPAMETVRDETELEKAYLALLQPEK